MRRGEGQINWTMCQPLKWYKWLLHIWRTAPLSLTPRLPALKGLKVISLLRSKHWKKKHKLKIGRILSGFGRPQILRANPNWFSLFISGFGDKGQRVQIHSWVSLKTLDFGERRV